MIQIELASEIENGFLRVVHNVDKPIWAVLFIGNEFEFVIYGMKYARGCITFKLENGKVHQKRKLYGAEIRVL
jgi:hypothetical protein